MNTEIKIIKISTSPDDIRYRLYVDSVFIEGFSTYEEAFSEAEKRIIAIKGGYPKSETVFTDTVEHLKTT